MKKNGTITKNKIKHINNNTTTTTTTLMKHSFTHLLLHRFTLVPGCLLHPFRGNAGGIGGEAVGNQDGPHAGGIPVVEFVEADQDGVMLRAGLLTGLVQPDDTATHLWEEVKVKTRYIGEEY